MYGAIIGDLAGSIYEYNQIKQVSRIKHIGKLITDESFYSDDTILTIAIADAIFHNGDYEMYLKKYGREYINYMPTTKKYFEKPFSPGFLKWLDSKSLGISTGNGALMRISPVGYMFNSLEEVNKNAILATIPSHNSKEAIDSAVIIATIIFLSRKGYSKQQIMKKLNIQLKYIPFDEFNYTCMQTIGNCLYALFTSNNFEDAIKTVLSYGGDTDTNACIVGSMAETLYGIHDDSLINQVNNKLPDEFVKILKKSYSKLEYIK